MSTNKLHDLLTQHAKHIQQQPLSHWLQDNQRLSKLMINTGILHIDLTKNYLNDATIELFKQWANALDIHHKIQALMSGEVVNISEQRPALHTALRDPHTTARVEGKSIRMKIQAAQTTMAAWTMRLRSGQWCGWQHERIRDVVCLGIGGSHLGPELVCQALQSTQPSTLRMHFVANIDHFALNLTLQSLKPSTTLFVVVSKSFSTQETLHNTQRATQWLKQHGCLEKHFNKHIVAITANPSKARTLGFSVDNILPFWDWVGGRYSLWSTVGLPIALMHGFSTYQQLLQGAHSMDNHVREQPTERNAAILRAMLRVFYQRCMHWPTQAVVPYDHRLRLLPAYLSQLFMESLGKSHTLQDHAPAPATTPWLFGDVGSNAEHSFYQMLHQGTTPTPIDMLIDMNNTHDTPEQQALLSHALAQSRALMIGSQSPNAYRCYPGNRPSTLLCFTGERAASLGALLALYEHEVYIHSLLCDINAFDQWGVELGKDLARDIQQQLQAPTATNTHLDPSTQYWINHHHQQTTKQSS